MKKGENVCFDPLCEIHKPTGWLGCTCILRDDSPFGEIFAGGPVPIKSVLPSMVNLVGDDEPLAYFLAWQGCTPVQRKQLAELVTKIRGGTPAEFLAHMDCGGDMPIRVSQTSGAFAPLTHFQ